MDQDKIYDGFTEPSAEYFADPSERRLTVYLSAWGVKAYLKNPYSATEGYRIIINTAWKCESNELLRHIENAVYDHPEVLDDYECDVIIESDKTLWLPGEVAEEDDVRCEIYSTVYPCDDEDIFMDTVKLGDGEEASCLYTLCPGLPSFLQRTFPGARVSCQLTQLFHRFYTRVTDEPTLFVDLRSGRMDMLTFRGNEFLMGCTHRYADDQDAYYHIINCLRQCGLDERKCEVYLSGDREVRTKLVNDLRDELTYVRNTMLPRIDAPADMPTAALVCEVNRRIQENAQNSSAE